MDPVTRHFPEGAPKAVGPYSAATSTGNMVFASGQIPLNPLTGLIEHEDIENQCHQVMKNLKAVIEGSGASMSSILKCTILLTDINDFPKVNAIYESYFQKDKYPARITYAVSALPKSAKVEIDALAVKLS